MLNLFLTDIYKMRKSAAMKILFCITLVCAVIMTMMALLIYRGDLGKNMTGIGFMFSDMDVISIIGAVIAGIFICGDFDNKSIHDEIACGNSRGSIVFSKAASFSIAVFAILLPYAVVTGIALCTGCKFDMGSNSSGFLNILTSCGGKALSASDIPKLLAVILTHCIVYAGQLSICVLLALLLRNPVLVVAIYYVMNFLSGQLQSLKGSSKIFDNIFGCTPYSGNYIMLNLNSSTGNILKAIAASVIYTAVILTITYFAFRKAEIK